MKKFPALTNYYNNLNLSYFDFNNFILQSDNFNYSMKVDLSKDRKLFII